MQRPIEPAQYTSEEWIGLATDAGITLSMSRKGYSPDNAACEGLFGRMKNEMYHHRRWSDVDELEQAIHDYNDFYNNKRIKNAYQGLSITEQRTLAGIQ
ncbi:IS3 family transposase [Flaviflexus sp.]|uniref:IS3 family transposase n=1 Tax=Flaviflexus sp. TaxID=1969482 RepID=UPI003F935E30